MEGRRRKQRVQWYASAPPGSPPWEGGSRKGRQGKRTDSRRGATALDLGRRTQCQPAGEASQQPGSATRVEVEGIGVGMGETD